MMRMIAFALVLGAAGLNEVQEYRLPFDGRWFVIQGGDTLNVNSHMAVRPQWFALDFAKVAGAGGNELARGQASKVEDFYSWGEIVRAPIAGEVVAVVNDLPDNPLGTKDIQNPAGNHVVVRVTEARFVFLAHLQKASAAVKVGQRIKVGDRLGLCGNSGNSDFPHVHMHVQDTADLKKGQGQNPTFSSVDVELNGKRFSKVTWPLIRGVFVG